MTSKEKFYRLHKNLYLVKTPEKGATGESMIEDFFQTSVLKTKHNGKTFNPSDDRDINKEYGKTTFAKQVVLAQKAAINFSKFSRLLDRLVAVMADYKASPAGS